MKFLLVAALIAAVSAVAIPGDEWKQVQCPAPVTVTEIKVPEKQIEYKTGMNSCNYCFRFEPLLTSHQNTRLSTRLNIRQSIRLRPRLVSNSFLPSHNSILRPLSLRTLLTLFASSEYKDNYVTKTETKTATITAAPVKEYVTKEVYVTVTKECEDKKQWGKWAAWIARGWKASKRSAPEDPLSHAGSPYLGLRNALVKWQLKLGGEAWPDLGSYDSMLYDYSRPYSCSQHCS